MISLPIAIQDFKGCLQKKISTLKRQNSAVAINSLILDS